MSLSTHPGGGAIITAIAAARLGLRAGRAERGERGERARGCRPSASR